MTTMKETAATTYAMTLLVPMMKAGKMREDDATAMLKAHHACTLKTLGRAGLVMYYGGYVYTRERYEKDLAKAEARAKAKALRAEVARLTKELEALGC